MSKLEIVSTLFNPVILVNELLLSKAILPATLIEFNPFLF